MVALALLLAGCSALRLAYGTAPHFGYWWLDGYFDFDAAQSERVRGAIERWFAWHRSAELPGIAAQLQRAQAEALQDTTPARVCRWWDEGRARLRAGVEQALPDFAELALTLGPAQLEHLQERQRKGNEDFVADFVQPDPVERRAAALKRTVERAEMLYGRIDDAQRELLARAIDASPWRGERALALRQARQRDLVAALRALGGGAATREQARAALQAVAQRAEVPPAAEDRGYVEAVERHACATIAALHNTTTPAQRLNAAQRLKGWELDLRALAGTDPR